MNQPTPEAEFVPFEIVRQEEARVVSLPARWQMMALAAAGFLALIGIVTLGMFVIFAGLLIAKPVLVLRAVARRLNRG